MGTAAVEHRPSRLRADASRNRERIVAAARDALVESGPDTPLDEIARRAGVGNATLYRNFADRRELFRTVTLSVLDQAARRGEASMAEEPDAFTALERFAHESAAARIGAQCTLLCMFDPREDAELNTARERLTGVVATLLDRARTAGQLRDDVGPGDLLVALAQLTRPLPGTGCPSIDHYASRHLQVFLDGLRAPARSTLPGTAATLEGLRRES
ncbi:TetR/AcrR family transcriptional regulator [Streptomyces sp. SL13]|uniref:TetR/AcrR family transcriptional regulator n=1 Tax=Streptantibioticus silvisoli TaxID=2705255 RepID=A0AA90KHG8_9ACTN|nr:TetR/AcrR family transcriptional regulator [Streptantibioticus silvisoli]MDI5971399.1 TetR/AcrR family transcriptional regulator [Streptantibioticus silvisoli]